MTEYKLSSLAFPEVELIQQQHLYGGSWIGEYAGRALGYIVGNNHKWSIETYQPGLLMKH